MIKVKPHKRIVFFTEHSVLNNNINTDSGCVVNQLILSYRGSLVHSRLICFISFYKTKIMLSLTFTL